MLCVFVCVCIFGVHVWGACMGGRREDAAAVEILVPTRLHAHLALQVFLPVGEHREGG